MLRKVPASGDRRFGKTGSTASVFIDFRSPDETAQRWNPGHGAKTFPDSASLHPGYAHWKYLRNAFARDAGLRIDHILLSPAAARRLQSAGVDREVRGRDHTSDHAPVWIKLKET